MVDTNILNDFNKAIIVTGTPATGKSTFAKKLCEENSKLKYFDINEYFKNHKYYESYSKEDESFIIDEEIISEIMVPLILNSDVVLVIDSHLSHYVDSKYVSKCYVTKCALPELKKRLESRNYSDKKVRDNLDSEIFDVCRIDAEELGHTIEIINTDSN